MRASKPRHAVQRGCAVSRAPRISCVAILIGHCCGCEPGALVRCRSGTTAACRTTPSRKASSALPSLQTNSMRTSRTRTSSAARCRTVTPRFRRSPLSCGRQRWAAQKSGWVRHRISAPQQNHRGVCSRPLLTASTLSCLWSRRSCHVGHLQGIPCLQRFDVLRIPFLMAPSARVSCTCVATPRFTPQRLQHWQPHHGSSKRTRLLVCTGRDFRLHCINLSDYGSAMCPMTA